MMIPSQDVQIRQSYDRIRQSYDCIRQSEDCIRNELIFIRRRGALKKDEISRAHKGVFAGLRLVQATADGTISLPCSPFVLSPRAKELSVELARRSVPPHRPIWSSRQNVRSPSIDSDTGEADRSPGEIDRTACSGVPSLPQPPLTILEKHSSTTHGSKDAKDNGTTLTEPQMVVQSDDTTRSCITDELDIGTIPTPSTTSLLSPPPSPLLSSQVSTPYSLPAPPSSAPSPMPPSTAQSFNDVQEHESERGRGSKRRHEQVRSRSCSTVSKSSEDKKKKKKNNKSKREKNSRVVGLRNIMNKFGELRQCIDVDTTVSKLQTQNQWIWALWKEPMELDNPRTESIGFNELPALVSEINGVEIAEVVVYAHKRMRLGRFHKKYALAKSNPQQFLRWTEEECPERHAIAFTPRKSQIISTINERFTDLVVHQSKNTRAKKSRVQAKNAINLWQRVGRLWSGLIDLLGREGLLLVPQELTDDFAEKMHQDEITSFLQTISDRKASFEKTLLQATKLFEVQLPQEIHAPRLAIDLPSPLQLQGSASVQSLSPLQVVDPRMLELPNTPGCSLIADLPSNVYKDYAQHVSLDFSSLAEPQADIFEAGQWYL